MARKILHVDLDAFFCAVEEKYDPSLKNKPFATGGSPEGRGVVTSCSYAARKYGIHSAMPMIQALRLYPELIIVESHYRSYVEHSLQMMEILNGLTPLVEQISIDEAFLDVTDLSSDSHQLASGLQMKIFSSLRLPCSIGAASNKLIAKIATNIGKASHKGDSYPMSIKVIPPGEEAAFLAPLPVKEMWGIGPKSAKQLNEAGFVNIGDIQKLSRQNLEKYFGRFADELIRRVNGIDERPVGDYEGVKSVSNEITFNHDISDEKELFAYLKLLSEKVGIRLRRKGLSGKTVRIKVRWPDFETHTRQITLKQPTNQDSIIQSAAVELFSSIWKKGKLVRLIGVGVAQLGSEFQQLLLFDDSYLTEKRLLDAIDQLKDKFGSDVVQKGVKPKGFRSKRD